MRSHVRCITLVLLVAAEQVFGQPVITLHPTSHSVSLGARVTLQVTTTGAALLAYQWRFNETPLANATNRILIFTNIAAAHAGDYVVTVTNPSGSVTSDRARLEVDPTFTKITTGPVVSNGGYSFACAWGDYDNDGFLDLFVANYNDPGTGNDFLYRNSGTGGFTRVISGPIVNNGAWSTAGAWGDYDNDGDLDLLVCMPDRANALYRNNGAGAFTKITMGVQATTSERSHAGVWGDVNNDGWLDFFVANFANRTTPVAKDNALYRGDGLGGFVRQSFGPKAAGNDLSFNAAWGDCNNDGWLDLIVPQGGVAPVDQRSLLYRNDRTGNLALVPDSTITAEAANSIACAWGDFNNDGWLDLFLGRSYGRTNALFRNNGDGSFTAIVDSVVTLDAATSGRGAWADYDNDGWLDLFVSNLGPIDAANLVSLAEGNNALYHNNGDGTFTQITSGSLVNDGGYSTGCAWGDYDNDGFPDLFVANGWITATQNNFLYRNSGNPNSWLNLRLIGTVSNRSAIGAKVRVRATIRGKTVWQLREISGGSNYGSQNDLRANFGLGNAALAELVRIEWPSGTVTELRDVAPKQFLTVIEPPRLTVTSLPPIPKITLRGAIGFTYVLEASPDLASWLSLRTNTATGLALEFEDMDAAKFSRRFYRAQQDGADAKNLPGSWVVGNAKIDRGTSNIHAGVLYPYVGSPQVYRCPADRAQLRDQPQVPRNRSYSMSLWLSPDIVSGTSADYFTDAQRRNLQSFAHITARGAASIWVLIDEHAVSLDDGVFSINGIRPPQTSVGGGRHWRSFPGERHSQGANLSFADGHVERHGWRHRRNPAIYTGETTPTVNDADLADLNWLKNGLPLGP